MGLCSTMHNVSVCPSQHQQEQKQQHTNVFVYGLYDVYVDDGPSLPSVVFVSLCVEERLDGGEFMFLTWFSLSLGNT